MFPQQTNLLKYRGNFRYDRERKRRQRSVQMPTEEQCLRIEIQIIIRVLCSQMKYPRNYFLLAMPPYKPEKVFFRIRLLADD